MPPPIIASVVRQHLEEATFLHLLRATLVRAGHVGLTQLGRSDERLRAHLDGLSVAGDAGLDLVQAALETPDAGTLFVAAVLAVERRDQGRIDSLLPLLDEVPNAPRALASACGWVPATSLSGLIAPLLGAADKSHRWLGMTACAAHRVDPGRALIIGVDDPDPRVRAQALRTVGLVGRRDLLPACLQHLGDTEPSCQLAAAASALLLGDRGAGVAVLQSLAQRGGEGSHQAVRLLLLSATPELARQTVRELAAQAAPRRTVILASAWSGDAQVVPWLIQQMADTSHARVAAEAFSFISGADLALHELEGKAPEAAARGPTESPDDDNVALDEDDGLPWPDQARVQAWWAANAYNLPQGQRCFVGKPAAPAHCMHVLRTAPQRQRHAASLLLSLWQPGTPVFNVAAPAHRQRRLLAASSAGMVAA